MKPLKRAYLEITKSFCGMPATLTNKVIFYSAAENIELDFRQKFNEEGFSLISVKILEVAESKLTEEHLYAIGN